MQYNYVATYELAYFSYIELINLSN